MSRSGSQRCISVLRLRAEVWLGAENGSICTFQQSYRETGPFAATHHGRAQLTMTRHKTVKWPESDFMKLAPPLELTNQGTCGALMRCALSN
jgi:hypothetical protein